MRPRQASEAQIQINICTLSSPFMISVPENAKEKRKLLTDLYELSGCRSECLTKFATCYPLTSDPFHFLKFSPSRYVCILNNLQKALGLLKSIEVNLSDRL